MSRASTARGLTVVETVTQREASQKVPDPVGLERMQQAGVRAIESAQRLRRKAETLMEEIDEVTPAFGIVTAELSDEDSLVTSVANVIATHGHK